ncbi:MAG: CBS domain-containing protein [Nitrososphaerota archaeon]|jgi:signal-transduction protein with cAMP-binding, CBS, and nucleotidyltransferase domain|nr:CBS domain-containing protein [Nitrososphaerota archaeon]MDG6928278.1 CBS domain-containing protein [Nitrososphaerota archaeon]MDG6929740.1 CBS domain-containing protein [Nitrososphaerota archaeon]MDG6932824.1 CBS domain-containing protein [Nitrososphaerota archaeon]MDG6935377.1 CBS domain-containing protein [Nitrososphaerota archaeon]
MSFEHSISLSIKVREVMTSPVISAHPEDNIKDVSKKMVESKVGSVIIVKDDKPLGVVTDGDIIKKVVSMDLTPSSVMASQIMTSPLITIKAESYIMDAAKLMNKYGIKRLGVTYKNELVGVISMTDIIYLFPGLMDVASEKMSVANSGKGAAKKYISGYCDACGQWSDFLMEVDGRFLCEECREEIGESRS